MEGGGGDREAPSPHSTYRREYAYEQKISHPPAGGQSVPAATDSRRMVALLEEALNWEGNENPVTDGERFYDLLVDQGYCG